MIVFIVFDQKYNLASRNASADNPFDSYEWWNLDESGSWGTLTNLSKDFYYIVHDFMIFKLEALVFKQETSNVMKN